MRSFAYWSEAAHDWHVDNGIFHIFAGDSSQDLPLHTDIDLQ
jgi:beta-glucosidase